MNIEAKMQRKNMVVLKIETYQRLDKYKLRIMNEKEDSKLTFDDIINELLDKAYEKGQHPTSSGGSS